MDHGVSHVPRALSPARDHAREPRMKRGYETNHGFAVDLKYQCAPLFCRVRTSTSRFNDATSITVAPLGLNTRPSCGQKRNDIFPACPPRNDTSGHDDSGPLVNSTPTAFYGPVVLHTFFFLCLFTAEFARISFMPVHLD